jgi:hypothetical protein
VSQLVQRDRLRAEWRIIPAVRAAPVRGDPLDPAQ